MATFYITPYKAPQDRMASASGLDTYAQLRIMPTHKMQLALLPTKMFTGLPSRRSRLKALLKALEDMLSG